MEHVGNRIRSLRRLKKVTLQQLADQIGMTASFLSQVERNQIIPSVQAMQKISKALSTSITYFFSENVDESVSIVRKGQRNKFVLPNDKVHYEILTPGLGGEVEFLLAKMQHGIETEEPFPHEGTEYGYLLSGQIKMFIGETLYDLNEGDSICFRADVPHAIHNISDQEAIMIWVRVNTGATAKLTKKGGDSTHKAAVQA